MPEKNKPDLKDPLIWWGAVLVGLGVGFGGLLGGLIGGGAGIGITQLAKKTTYSKGKKYTIAAGLTAAAIVVYILLVSVVLELI